MLLNTNLVLVREFGFMDPWQFVTYALSVYATISMYVIDLCCSLLCTGVLLVQEFGCYGPVCSLL